MKAKKQSGDKSESAKTDQQKNPDLDEVLEEFRKIREKQEGTVRIKDWIEEGRR